MPDITRATAVYRAKMVRPDGTVYGYGNVYDSPNKAVSQAKKSLYRPEQWTFIVECSELNWVVCD